MLSTQELYVLAKDVLGVRTVTSFQGHHVPVRTLCPQQGCRPRRGQPRHGPYICTGTSSTGTSLTGTLCPQQGHPNRGSPQRGRPQRGHHVRTGTSSMGTLMSVSTSAPSYWMKVSSILTY